MASYTVDEWDRCKFKVKGGYLNLVLSTLENGQMEIKDIMERGGIPESKKVYVIDAIKKGIEKGKIEMIVNPETKNKFYGNFFKLV